MQVQKILQTNLMSFPSKFALSLVFCYRTALLSTQLYKQELKLECLCNNPWAAFIIHIQLMTKPHCSEPLQLVQPVPCLRVEQSHHRPPVPICREHESLVLTDRETKNVRRTGLTPQGANAYLFSTEGWEQIELAPGDLCCLQGQATSQLPTHFLPRPLA